MWLEEQTQWTLHTSAPPCCHQTASTGSTPVKGKWLQDWTAAYWTRIKLSSPNLYILHQVWQHHNHPTLSLIDHLPEVSTGGLQWSLCDDEPFPLFVALQLGRKGMGWKVENMCAFVSVYVHNAGSTCFQCTHAQKIQRPTAWLHTLLLNANLATSFPWSTTIDSCSYSYVHYRWLHY